MPIDLLDIKRHLRLDLTPDPDSDPELINMLESAVDYASKFIGRDIPWEDEDQSPVFPASVRAAILLIIGDLYENREGRFVGVAQTPNPAVLDMLHFYRLGLGI